MIKFTWARIFAFEPVVNTRQCEIQYLGKIVEPITKEERDGDEDLYGKRFIVLENENICSKKGNQLTL